MLCVFKALVFYLWCYNLQSSEHTTPLNIRSASKQLSCLRVNSIHWLHSANPTRKKKRSDGLSPI